MYGYAGKVLTVDLTRKESSEAPLKTKWAEKYLGGRGLGARYFFSFWRPKVDAFSPENVLLIMTGPFTAVPAPSVHKFEVIAKSPLTGLYCCSSVGGTFGVELKRAGYDAIIVHGKAKRPVYIWISNGKVEIKNADSLWGLDTDVTRDVIKKEVGDKKAKVLRIGPAGERKVRYANIMSEPERSAGRGGLGAVMGSKNLKAIAVRGTQEIHVANPEGLREYAKELFKIIRENPTTSTSYPHVGTMGSVGFIAELGMLPYRNFQTVLLDVEGKIDANTWRAKYVIKDTAPCFICPIGCGKISEIERRKVVVEGPDFETCWAFTSQCGILDLEPAIEGNMLCDKYGMDTISTGNSIGFAMECFERGLISEGDTGLKLMFGNSEAMIEMIKKIALRKDFGDLLAEGVKRAADKIGRGAEHYAMHVKGLELPAYDPRGAWGMGLALGTACRGGDHLKAWTIRAEVLSGKYKRFSTDGKAKLVANLQNESAVKDSLVSCIYNSFPIEVAAELLSKVTGKDYASEDLTRIGRRICNLERVLLTIGGVTREDDFLSQRFLEEVLPNGPAKGRVITRSNFDKMLSEYYDAQGWDKSGRPTVATLKNLDMADAARVLQKFARALSARSKRYMLHV